MERPVANSYWVLPGSLLAGEYPCGTRPADARERLARLLDAGIDSFIDLTEPGERPEYHSLLPRSVAYLRSPIADAGVPAQSAQMQSILAYLSAGLVAGRRLYLHCQAGIGRTGVVVGCYLTEQGLDGAAALLRLNRLWQQSARAASWPQVPQTLAQAQFICTWPERGGTLAAARPATI